ncbi:MAG: hypothetical protein ABI995_15220, partial [Acidobacteriota bacterium]
MLLLAVLIAGILTMWVPALWPLAAFQLALFTLAAARLRTPGFLRNEPKLLLLACPAVWGILQFFAGWTVAPFRTQEEILNWTTNLTGFALAFDLARDPARRERFLTCLLAFACALSVLAMLTVFSSPPGWVFWSADTGTNLPTLGPFVYRNQYAAFVEAVVPLALLRALAVRRAAPLYLIGVALLFSSVIAGGSRTGAILCTVEILAVPLLTWSQGLVSARSMARVTFGSLLAALAFTLVAGWEFIWSRFQEPNPFG